MVDFGAIQNCYSGSGVPYNNPACEIVDFDVDQDVDMNDFDQYFMDQTGVR